MRHDEREAVRALLGLPKIVPIERIRDQRTGDRLYQVSLCADKHILLDTKNRVFRAARWGYYEWTPVARGLRFFLDVYNSGPDEQFRGPQPGERRRSRGDYDNWRNSLACRYDNGRRR